ncbi:MAG TPA: hypothetical protein VHQ03_06700 [Candidatus Dormibacteraeota bacterium]|nr:hypothetical protein [Candidatus Dormibacteraeota bacterium]
MYAGPPGSGGFITFPGGGFIADPKSSVTAPSPPGQTSPTPPGYGPAYPGLAYDRQYSRWVPVSYRQLSEDGSHYAFLSGSSVFAVAVATNAPQQLGAGQSWVIIDVKNEGVYASKPNTGGLWLLTYDGAAHQLSASGYWQAVGGGAAYGTATSAVPSGVANTIIRFDLRSSSTTEWFTRPGQISIAEGFDTNGAAIVYSNQQVWLVSSPTSAHLLDDSGRGGTYVNGPPIADKNGIWFSGNGIDLLVPNVAIYGVSTYGAQLAGGCS